MEKAHGRVGTQFVLNNPLQLNYTRLGKVDLQMLFESLPG